MNSYQLALNERIRKSYVCAWCKQGVEVGSQGVIVRGGDGAGFRSGLFHPECWRAEYFYWLEGDHFQWPGNRLGRGRTDERFDLPSEYSSIPLTEAEILKPWEYCAGWFVVDLLAQI